VHDHPDFAASFNRKRAIGGRSSGRSAFRVHKAFALEEAAGIFAGGAAYDFSV
jgi:hypothetical protein